MKKKLSAVFLSVLMFSIAVSAGAEVTVYVSVPPQKYFTEQVGGERVNVSVLVEKGQDPHTFEPLPAQMASLSRAELYLSIGLPFEKSLLPRLRKINPGLRVFPADRGIEKTGEEHGSSETHGQEHEHKHGGGDPHVWNGVHEAGIIAENILNALTEVDPGGEEYYLQNFQTFKTRLDKLDSELRELFRGKEGTAFLVFHPAWGYLAREYGLDEVAIESEGKEPKASDLAALISSAKKKGIKTILISPQFSRRTAEIIAGNIGANVETVDPLAEEWEEKIRTAAHTIAAAAK